MTRCIEHIAYIITPSSLDAFRDIKSKVAAEAHDLPGLISSTTQQSVTDPHAFVDTMVWESKDAAVAGLAAFEKLPTTPAFLGMMAGPPQFMGQYEWTAGDRSLELV